MKAIVLSRTGDPSVLEYTEVPTPRPKRGEVLVKADTIGVSRPELLVRRGVYAWMPPLPAIPGIEIAGRARARRERARSNAARRGGRRRSGRKRRLFRWISQAPAFFRESWIKNGTRGADLRGARGAAKMVVQNSEFPGPAL